MHRTVLSVIVLAFGAILISFGVILLTLIPHKIARTIEQDLHLGFDANGSYNVMTERWIRPQYSMNLKISVLSITNSREIVEQGHSPAFNQKGPYVFTEYQEKVKVDFMENNTRVLYRNKRWYVFNQTASCENCTLQDKVTFPNIFFQSLLDMILKSPPFIRNLIVVALKNFFNEAPFITKTVDEMLFAGYDDQMITDLCKKPFIDQFCQLANIPLKIRFLENNTEDGEYYVGTGLDDAVNIGKVYEWNGRNETVWWRTFQAKMLNGTDANLFPPNLSRFDILRIFLGQIGRSIYVRYVRKDEFQGVPVYRYIVPKEVYDPFLEENKGFCNPKTPRFFDEATQPDGCLPAGLFDVGYTKFGSPRVYLSGAHFFNSPEILYKNFVNFVPPSGNDEFFFNLEPNTGAVVQVSAASQINVGMITGDLKIFGKMHNMIVPVLLLNEVIVFDEATKSDLIKVAKPMRAIYMVGMALLLTGIAFWTVFLAAWMVNTYWRKDEVLYHIADNDNSSLDYNEEETE